MPYSYLVVIKIKNIFNSTINKVILFSSIENAYNYGLNYDLYIQRNQINSIDEAIKTNLIWNSKGNFPIYVCKIYQVDNDIICNIYQGMDQEKLLVQSLYKNLKINNLLSIKKID